MRSAWHSLTLTPGRCLALMGPSGSGKSTLAKLLQGFHFPEEGNIQLDGRDIKQLAANEQLPNGYQTEVGERGVGLSGGQKQRIAIARSLLKQPCILIFDEATANLDHATAEHFAHTVNKLKGRVTMLFIAHQLPKGLHVDEVITLGEHGAKMAVVGEGGGE